MVDYDPKEELKGYSYPPIDLLEKRDVVFSPDEVVETKEILIRTLRLHGIAVKSVETTVGYTNTLLEIIPSKAVRLAQVQRLQAELSFHLNSSNIWIEPLFKRGTIGVIVPNRTKTVLPFRLMVDHDDFKNSNKKLPVIVGQTLSHENILIDLNEKSHILVSGATGQGKSVLLHVIIASLLYKKHPSEIKFVLFDPVIVELNLYSLIEKHFLAMLPVRESSIIHNAKGTIDTLHSLTIEMSDRFELLLKAKVRNINEYNVKFKKRRLNPSSGHRFMPFIVVVMDKYASIVPKDGEAYISNLVRKAHRVGMHLVISVQRPSHDVIPEEIKRHIPVRIAFKTSSRQESKFIIDENGAEKLAGKGDAIYKDEFSKVRVQVPLITTDEVEKITAFIESQEGFDSAFPLPEVPRDSMGDEFDSSLDPLFAEAARLIVVHQQGSTSLIQRKFSIGYNRANRLMDQLEMAGVVGPTQGVAPREVLIGNEYSLERRIKSFLPF